jgi:hypothetical protein
MKAELKRIYCPDFDIKNHFPEDENNFCIFLQIFVGIQHGLVRLRQVWLKMDGKVMLLML